MDSTKNNNNTNTMNIKATDNNNSTISMTEGVTNKPSCKRAGEPNPLLYKAAARNLREYHGVPSMTPGGLEKTMVLLQLRPGRLVAQGLAPKHLLKGNSAARTDADNTDSSSSSSSSSSSGSEDEPEQTDNNQVSDDSSSNSSDGSDTEHDNIATQDSILIQAGANKHPIHAVFVAAGIQLRPRETRPLLRALGVGPHHVVKLGLVQREELRRSRPGGKQHGPPHQQHGHPGGRGHHHHRGGGGMSRPHGPPPHGPPPHRHGHGHGRRPAHGDHRRSSGGPHGPPRGPFQETGGLHLQHGPGHRHRGPGHHHYHGGESEGEEEIAMTHDGPRGPPHRMHPSPHLRGQHGGPRPQGMPMHDRQMHLHHGPGHHHHHGGGKSEGEEEIAMTHDGPRGPPHGMPPPPHLRGQHGGPRPHGMPMHDRQMNLHHGPGHHHHHGGGEDEGEEEEMAMHAGPSGPPHGMHPPPHLRGQHGRPLPHGMPMHDRQMHHGPGHHHHHHHHDVHISGGEEEHCAGTHTGPGHRAHPRRHHGMHHLDGDGDAAGMDMDHSPVPHRAGRRNHRDPVGLHHQLHGPPPGPLGMRGGLRCDLFGDDFHPRQHHQHQHHQQHGRLAASRARARPCHESPPRSPMMPMQAY